MYLLPQMRVGVYTALAKVISIESAGTCPRHLSYAHGLSVIL